MASPSSSLATLRNDLGASFNEFDVDANMAGFIAQQVLPAIEVGMQAGQFGKIPLKQLLANRDTRRAPGSGYARGKFTFDKAVYACEEHGAEEPCDDREANMFRDFFDQELMCSARAREVVMRNAEQRAADMVFNPTVWTGSALTTAVTNEWNDPTNATPIADIEGGIQAVYAGSGLWPNAMIISNQVFRNLRLVDEIKELVKYNGFTDPKTGNITAQVLAQVFAIPRVIVAGGTTDTANEGQAASLGPIWSNEYCMICKVPVSQDFREPAIGRTFHWSEDGSNIGGTFESYREEQTRSDVVRVRHDVDEIITYINAGHLLSNITG
jgi:hypothetical protein